MKYENYKIEKDDKRNWKVSRFDDIIANRDIILPKTKEVHVKKGEAYVKKTFLGFYSDISHALNGIVRDKAGEGCETISELANQITQIKDSLKGLLK